MATWKKVIVSGSQAELAAVSASSGVLVGTNQAITTTQAGTFLTGSFTGSFKGDGSNLTGVTATAIFPTTAVTNVTSTDKFFISQSTGQEYITYGNLLTDLAGTNLAVESSDSLTLASTITGITSITATSVSASFTGSLTGALTGTASYASQANSSSYASTATSASYATQANNSTNLNSQAASYYLNASNINAGTLGNAYLPSQINVTGVSASFTGSLIGALTGTASYASQANSSSYALNSTNLNGQAASYYTNATNINAGTIGNAYLPSQINVTGVSASFLGNLTGTASYASMALTASYASNVPTTASYALTASNISPAITNNTNNYVLTATGIGTINGESNLAFDGTTLTVTGNATVTGDLTVAGTASFTNTDNLTIKDKFILINSGSSALADSGWITQYNAAGSGSAFYLEAGAAGSTGTYGRFAVAYDVIGTSTALTADEFVVTAKTAAGAPATNPTWGGTSNGYGNIYVNSSTGDIFIYS
mgnify:CR=1 FL=1